MKGISDDMPISRFVEAMKAESPSGLRGVTSGHKQTGQVSPSTSHHVEVLDCAMEYNLEVDIQMWDSPGCHVGTARSPSSSPVGHRQCK
jgi:hypothetical protein